MTRQRDSWRTVLALLLAAVLVVSAGCAGFGGQAETDPGTDDPETADAPEDSDGGSDGDGDTDGDSDASDGDDSDGDDSDGDGESHDHDSHDHDSNDVDSDDGNDYVPDGADLGKLRVVVDGEELDLSEQGDRDAGFWMAITPRTVWISNQSVTVSEALSTLGIETDGETLTYGGTTYDASDEDTSIHVRVNGETKAPGSYELADGDDVWVVVETAAMDDVDHMDAYVPEDGLHAHGTMDVTVDGESVNFSETRYQGLNAGPYFHFHDHEQDRWHAHSWALSLEYVVSTLDGMDLTDEAFTYEGETYDLDDENVRVEVNGEPVTPSEHYLVDGDDIRIVVETDD